MFTEKFQHIKWYHWLLLPFARRFKYLAEGFLVKGFMFKGKTYITYFKEVQCSPHE